MLQIHSYCIFQLLKYKSKLQAMTHFTEQVVINQQSLLRVWGVNIFFLTVQGIGVLKQHLNIPASDFHLASYQKGCFPLSGFQLQEAVWNSSWLYHTAVL